jgi:pyruvate, water dikinase
MAVFDKIRSGLPGLDLMLDGIRIGDNVVWQVSSVDDYRLMAERFCRQAIEDGRTMVYIRFAPHPPILEAREGLIVHKLDPSLGFEHFTGEVHRIAAQAGAGAFYAFDCLSELQTAWAADLMMGNFFAVTCPYLFELDTVAWFCLMRDRHSYETIARIRETTQLFLDLFADGDNAYVHPIKVWKRYSPTMFFPHRLDLSAPEEIIPLTDGVSISRFYRAAGTAADPGSTQHLDSWERFFIGARESAASRSGDEATIARAMAERLLGSEPRFLALALKNFGIADFLEIKDRMIGSGKIGGKTAGMALARKIVERAVPDIAGRIEPHDSFYVGSDVFYTYLVNNRLWKQRISQRSREGYFDAAPALRDGMLSGVFPDGIRQQFVRMLDYFGQSPIIVRSSSLLEDGFGNAFAGKYESIFCVNSGAPEERLEAFESALRTVYASTMDSSALAYRQQRGLADMDEQMAILVQRVSGSLFKGFFMPAMAGVGYSLNAWRWHKDIDPKAGMLRLVAGLGTRAVDRTGSDYPRLVSLGRPDLDPAGSADRGQYCQRNVDLLDLGARALATKSIEEIIPDLPPWLLDILTEHDRAAERYLSEKGNARDVLVATCAGAVGQKRLLDDLSRIMRALEEEYANPVDIEFTVNWNALGEYSINLLQCRPLQSPSQKPAAPGMGLASLESKNPADLFFALDSDVMGPQLQVKVDAVVMVDARSYYSLPLRDKPSVARAVGTFNARYKERGGIAMLVSPGRIGTSSPELGVPVSFAEIDHFKIICELAYDEAGYRPELSFGSHFFQDLVETDIYYAAIPEKASAGVSAFVADMRDKLLEFIPGSSLPPGLVRVYEPEDLWFVSDLTRGACVCARILPKA